MKEHTTQLEAALKHIAQLETDATKNASAQKADSMAFLGDIARRKDDLPAAESKSSPLQQMQLAKSEHANMVNQLKHLINPVRIVIYFRVSTKIQAKGNSIKKQEWDIRELIRLLGWEGVHIEVVVEVCSGGITSGEGSQPLLREIMSHWVPGQILICRTPDRWTRNEDLARKFWEKGCSV